VLAEGVAAFDGTEIDPSLVETNIVIFEVAEPAAVVAGLLVEGVEVTQMGPGRIRAVTHMDVDRAGIERALEALRKVLG
jgi:threonine aldolase